eukprot:9033024-Pyramimonas_sp.AAC.1
MRLASGPRLENRGPSSLLPLSAVSPAECPPAPLARPRRLGWLSPEDNSCRRSGAPCRGQNSQEFIGQGPETMPNVPKFFYAHVEDV